MSPESLHYPPQGKVPCRNCQQVLVNGGGLCVRCIQRDGSQSPSGLPMNDRPMTPETIKYPRTEWCDLADEVAGVVAHRDTLLTQAAERDALLREALVRIEESEGEMNRLRYRISTLMAINEGHVSALEQFQRVIEEQRVQLFEAKAAAGLHSALMRDAS